MLPRVLEPELMDSPQEALAYDSMDHREVNRRFVADLLETLAPQFQRHELLPLQILDLGAGTAQIPIELCRRQSNVDVVALDAARHMLELARRNVEAAQLSGRIRLVLADAKRPIEVADRFDAVISNSIVHHLPNPIECLREAIAATGPGGLLFFRDLLRPNDQIDLIRLVDQYAPAADSSPAANDQRAMFAASLHAALTLGEVRRLIQQLGFAPEGVRATSDRHWSWSANK